MSKRLDDRRKRNGRTTGLLGRLKKDDKLSPEERDQIKKAALAHLEKIGAVK